jgi:EAL domain-containing protein (putative c-di-GMP-specific phosphodiesterase class I)/AmiR/NasT family two-component response regulator
MLERFADADVLVVDDNPANVALLRAILERARLRNVRTYTDPREAVASLQRQPDLALVDLHMPHLDGYAVLERLAEGAAGTYLPTVILTADASTEALRRALKCGAQDFITKPFDAMEVLLRVRNLLQTSYLHKELRMHNRWLRSKVDEHRAREEAERGEYSQLEARIASVLRTQALTPVYQPIAEVSTGRIVGVEALSRFPTEPGRPPDVWFAEAERVGLGVDLQLLAIQRALEALENLPPEVFLAVNLSPAVVLDPGRRLLRMAEAVLGRLVLELTEHTPVEDYDALNAAIAPLRDGGARLAVDDTGAGYAGLQHLVALAPDVVKLDLSLTRGVDRDPTRRALASALVRFGRDTGARVVAEGVETQAELEALRVLEVPWAQGYLIARPQPLVEVLPMCTGRER